MATIDEKLNALEETQKNLLALRDRVGKLEGTMNELGQRVARLTQSFVTDKYLPPRLDRLEPQVSSCSDKMGAARSATDSLRDQVSRTLDALKSKADSLESKLG